MTGAPLATKLRKIIHCDCDCFYAAVETRDDPAIAGRPVAVGGWPDRRGVVATCNYEARRFGVHSAMPTSQALRLCPDLLVIRPNMEKYRVASQAILGIYRRYTDLIEPLSLDEAYLDVSDSQVARGSATLIAREIKERVHSEVGITVSAGVAPNKFLAKIASDWNKPDGLFVIRPEEVDALLAQLPVERIFGVGAVLAAKLRNAGMHTCAEVQQRSRPELRALCGRFGDRLYELARGVDPRVVSNARERKSLSIEETYVEDLRSLSDCRAQLDLLVERLVRASAKLEGDECIEALFVKIRFDDWTKTTAEHIAQAIDRKLLDTLLERAYARAGRAVRLLGVGARIGRNDAAAQMKLFDAELAPSDQPT